MCIVIIKKSGVNAPNQNILNNCFDNNSDGAGVMYLNNGQVQIDKGYMTKKAFTKRLKKLAFNKDDTVIYHFRLATHGATKAGQTHPFPVSEIDKDLLNTRIETGIAMAHNGILSAMQSDKILSDTMMYIKHIVSPIKDMIFDKSMSKLLSKSSVGSRLVFLNGKGNILTTGEWITDNGLFYSNNGYKELKYLGYSDSTVSINDDFNWNKDEKIEYTDCVQCPSCENISYSESEGYCYECYHERFDNYKDEDDFYNGLQGY